MKLEYIALTKLSPNPFRPRQTIRQDKLLNLADSLRKYKVITPLLVAKTPAGLQVVNGERRLRAAKMAGLQKVPCLVVRDLDPIDLALFSLTDSLQSEPLNLLEQAGVLQKLQQEYKLSTHEMAERLGLEEDQVEEIQKVAGLPDQIKSSYLAREINDQALLMLVKIEDRLELMDEFNNYRSQQVQFHEKASI